MDKEEFLKIYNNLPKPLQEALYSDEIISVIKSVGLLAKLNDKQLFVLNETVTDVLLGQIASEDFSKELKTRLEIPETSMEIIRRIIQDKIFKLLRKELEKCKQLLVPQPKSLKKEVPSKLPTSTKKDYNQPASKQPLSESVIPKYSFPEPSEIKIERPVNKAEKLKKVVAPKISSEEQEKIREKLLAAMQKKDVQPKIVERMKKVSFKKPPPTEKKEPLRKKSMGEVASSKILSGEGKEFKDEEVFLKTKKEKPYILDVKLKEKKARKEKLPTAKEAIPYKKYQKESPFGQA